MNRPLVGEQYAELWDHPHVAPVEMIDGTYAVIHPGDTVVWEPATCHCCRNAIRIEKRKLN